MVLSSLSGQSSQVFLALGGSGLSQEPALCWPHVAGSFLPRQGCFGDGLEGFFFPLHHKSMNTKAAQGPTEPQPQGTGAAMPCTHCCHCPWAGGQSPWCQAVIWQCPHTDTGEGFPMNLWGWSPSTAVSQGLENYTRIHFQLRCCWNILSRMDWFQERWAFRQDFQAGVSAWALLSYCTGRQGREQGARFAQVSPASTSCPTTDPFTFSFCELVMVRRQGTSSPKKGFGLTFPTFERFSWGLWN